MGCSANEEEDDYHIDRLDVRRSAFNILIGKPTRKRPLGRPRGEWEDNIRMDLKLICINTRNWVESA